MKKFLFVVTFLVFSSTVQATPYTLNSGWQTLSFNINQTPDPNAPAGIRNLEGSFDFTIDLGVTAILQVTDINYDFEVYSIYNFDNNLLLGTSFPQGSDVSNPNFTTDFNTAFNSSLWSSGSLTLAPGDYSITGRITRFQTVIRESPYHLAGFQVITQSVPEPNIIISPTSHDFGSINIGDTSTAQLFTITNTGNADLIIGFDSISLTGADASEFYIWDDDCSSQIIEPSLTCPIYVEFSPTSEGIKSAYLSISSNDPDTSVLDVHLSGTGIDPDDVDDDGDGYTEYEGDCNDGDDTVYPEACDIKGDGIDQDCKDGDRTKGKPCPDIGGGGSGSNKETICDDGIDNDGDGLTDCADRDCRKDPACSDGGGSGSNKERNCTDGIDNDDDGYIDCDDHDCRKDPACSG